MNSIDLIIPTMWSDSTFVDTLKYYNDLENINKIILVDNNYTKKPILPKLSKTILVDYKKNLYVNPSWNEGFRRSKANIICILNDDILVDNKIFAKVKQLDFSNIDLIGVSLNKDGIDNYTIGNSTLDEIVKLQVNRNQPIGGQAWAFGVCMFIKRSSYKVIPSLYQVWFGDDYLVQRSNHVYVIKTNLIKGKISSTFVEQKNNKDITNRMRLDASNVFRFNHFLNGKNWDIVKSWRFDGV